MKLLNKKIKEHLCDKFVDILQDSLLLEMAIDRKKYEDKVDNETDQIIINMILVKLSSHNKKYENLANHWKGELRGHIENIRKLTIKNDSPEKRKKIINNLWNEYDLNWRELAVIYRIQYKLEDENIDVDSQETRDAVKWLINEIKEESLQKVLVSQDRLAVKKYINSI